MLAVSKNIMSGVIIWHDLIHFQLLAEVIQRNITRNLVIAEKPRDDTN